MKMFKQFRAGDLLLTKIKLIPKSAKKKDTDILLEGEITGHIHRLSGGKSNIFVTPKGVIYLSIISPTIPLTHEEHKTINVPKGKYKITRQREFDAYQGVIRNVED